MGDSRAGSEDVFKILQLISREPGLLHALRNDASALFASLKRGIKQANDTTTPLHAPSSIRGRVKDVKAIKVSWRRAHKRFSREDLFAVFGGNFINPRPQTNLREACTPYLPTEPGAPGVLISPTPCPESWPAFENVLTSDSEDGLRRYNGRYELLELGATKLTVEELNALPRHLLLRRVNTGHDTSRILPDLNKQLYARASSSDGTRPKAASEGGETVTLGLTCTDIESAFFEKEEFLHIFAMRPVSYDTGVVMQLERSVNSEGEHSADDGNHPRPRAY
ncbi:hypothetical protein K488DRAFT_90402 [Vararia minispora EC-137]|uniref:Uncharacterized protein n=1 Tax=Vararia minispora EC-137 TaxID=1314806 RepID=A0ACB8Q8A0_9AGAM|nr:hypothetical protein K488DRAFT_90402 [Vararia minispora EC-137]